MIIETWPLENMITEMNLAENFFQEALVPSKEGDKFETTSLGTKIPREEYLFFLLEKFNRKEDKRLFYSTYEIFCNAFIHGNSRNPALPINVNLLRGDYDYMQVKNSGKGFDVLSVLNKKRAGLKYSSRTDVEGGLGFEQMDYSDWFPNEKIHEIFFSEGGRQANIKIHK